MLLSNTALQYIPNIFVQILEKTRGVHLRLPLPVQLQLEFLIPFLLFHFYQFLLDLLHPPLLLPTLFFQYFIPLPQRFEVNSLIFQLYLHVLY